MDGQRKMTNRSLQIYHVPALVLLCGVLFFTLLGSRPLWDIDEGMHAATSKQMIQTGDWVTPYFNGEPFYDKPPLYNWLAAISFLVLGFTEFAARLPAALLGLGCVLLTYFGGRRIFDATTGFMGAAVLATSIQFIIMSRAVLHDIALAFFITLSLFLFFAGYEDPVRRRRLFLGGYLAIGMSIVAKGPIGLVLPVMAVGLFLIFQRDLKFVKQMRMGWGLPIALAVGSPWYILAMIKDPDYVWYFFIGKNLGSFFSDDASRHLEPFYFYLPVLFGGFLPWSFFLPAALVRCFKGGAGRLGPGKRYLLVWAGSVFLFFSAASSKLPTYILPMFPAASLLVADYWRGLTRESGSGTRRWFLFSLGGLAVIAVVATIGLWLFPLVRLQTKYGIEPTLINYLSLVLCLWGCAAFVMAVKRRFELAFGSLVGLVVCGLIFFNGLIIPMVNPYRSTKELGIALSRMLPEGEELVFFRRVRDSALFYTDRTARVIKPPDHETFFRSSTPVYCIVKESDLKWFKSMDGIYILDRRGNRLLMSNRPQPGNKADS
jgi:4-amino-4-deoxy-L-arabinose transferase-like glycosyltransferase